MDEFDSHGCAIVKKEKIMIKTRKDLDFYLMADLMMNRGLYKYTLLQKIKEVFSPDYIMRYLVAMRKYSYYREHRMGGQI